MLRRGLLANALAIGLVGLVSRGRGARAASKTAACTDNPQEIVVHKGWVLRRSDLSDGVGITPFSSDAH